MSKGPHPTLLQYHRTKQACSSISLVFLRKLSHSAMSFKSRDSPLISLTSNLCSIPQHIKAPANHIPKAEFQPPTSAPTGETGHPACLSAPSLRTRAPHLIGCCMTQNTNQLELYSQIF